MSPTSVRLGVLSCQCSHQFHAHNCLYWILIRWKLDLRKPCAIGSGKKFYANVCTNYSKNECEKAQSTLPQTCKMRGTLQKCSILDEAWKLVSDIENVRQKTELCLKKTVSQRTQLSCLKLKKLEVTDVLKLKSIR